MMESKYDLPDAEEIARRTNDPAWTKIAGAVAEWRYDHRFDLIDRRGHFSRVITEHYPKDGYDSELQYELSETAVSVKMPAIKTTIAWGIERAAFAREHMVPGTLDYYGQLSIDQLDVFRNEFPDVENLKRLGLRVQQFNEIDEKRIRDCKRRFNEFIFGPGSLLQSLRSANVQVKGDESIVVHNMTETLTRGTKVIEYNIRLQAAIGSSNLANSLFKANFAKLNDDFECLFSDIDIYIAGPVTPEDARRLCRRATERAAEIHALIVEVVTNG